MTRALALAVLLAPLNVLAGAQREEPIDPAVLATLTAQVADRAAPYFNFKSPVDGHRWVHEMSERLRKRVPDRKDRIELLKTVQYEATRAGLDPQLVLGVIHHESNFRKYAVSVADARGFMQVMPFWVKLIGTPDQNLFQLRTNLRYGCTILRNYLDVEKGDVYRALGRYNGSLGRPEYPTAVMSAAQRYQTRPSVLAVQTVSTASLR